ncbi:hypothetical protein EVAR_40479_1 [Eumeta japonica]|uniref:Integrase zinc-binding domain-containing protein n=1 Tax=Eumeta variegata TaxID=151549 RepID=A0A4C1XVW2_EUMVA|nr:hypothetical protein EVAR_40479_1 [Eumeta japonica]
MYHGNYETVINELQQKYVIFGLRNAVKRIIFKCQWCRVYRRKPTAPQQRELLTERLKVHEPPFNCSVVDYFGAMIVSVRRWTEKLGVGCLNHLTNHARRTPRDSSQSHTVVRHTRIPSLHGATRHADRDILRQRKQLNQSRQGIKGTSGVKYATVKRIVWKFIPPVALHMSGVWERMIKTIKSSLYAVLKGRKPREETLHILLLEVEHIINSRPLTPVEHDLNRKALTPSHFLIGRSCGVTSEHVHSWPPRAEGGGSSFNRRQNYATGTLASKMSHQNDTRKRIRCA